MNGGREGIEESVMMNLDGRGEKLVYMWGYLPGALPQRSPLLSPVVVRLPQSSTAGSSWKDVCGGGCGFALAISGIIGFCYRLTSLTRLGFGFSFLCLPQKGILKLMCDFVN